MKLRNRPTCIADHEVHFVIAPETEHAAWGQFDRIERMQEEQLRRHGWQQIVDQQLIEWGRHPSAMADDGLEPPTADAIAVASRMACALRDEGIAIPTHVAPNGDGGIVFHFQNGNTLATVEIDSDGCSEWRILRDGRLEKRSNIVT